MLSESGGIAAGERRVLRRFPIADRHVRIRLSPFRRIERRLNECVVSEAACMAAGLRSTQKRRPNVVTVDLHFGETAVTDPTKTLAVSSSDVRVFGNQPQTYERGAPLRGGLNEVDAFFPGMAALG